MPLCPDAARPLDTVSGLHLKAWPGCSGVKGFTARADKQGVKEVLSRVLDGRPVLEYQPAVDLEDGRLLGFEALVRWDHPTRGYIPPNILIPWAEANGHIVDLNAWVLAAACRQATPWPIGVQLSVNCSAVQLREREASRAVEAALEETGFDPHRLTVEITETTVADESTAADLRALPALGVHLAVDDVGTSWSTLENLRRFDIETAKIDRAFITSLEPHEGMNRAIVDAIVHVAQSLSMTTVAEGIETAQQVAILRDFGADIGQGYFFARPLTASVAHALAMTEPRPVFALVGEQPEPPSVDIRPRPLRLITNDAHRPARHVPPAEAG
jgi:EAL domain-containing protein (putative c-di-GMP-specific phosphodiesterase class I)